MIVPFISHPLSFQTWIFAITKIFKIREVSPLRWVSLPLVAKFAIPLSQQRTSEGTRATYERQESGHWQAVCLPFCEISSIASANLSPSPALIVTPTTTALRFPHLNRSHLHLSRKGHHIITHCTFTQSGPSLPHFGIPTRIFPPPDHRTPSPSEHQHDV